MSSIIAPAFARRSLPGYAPRLLSLKTCNRYEQRFLQALRATTAGPAWRSHAVHEFEGMGISPEASFVFLRLMEAIEGLRPSIAVLSPQSAFVTPDELNLLTTLRRASGKQLSAELAECDLGFSMPLALTQLLALCGEVLRQSTVRFNSRAMLSMAASVEKAEGELVQVTDARTLRPTIVVSNELITSRMRRVQLTGPALAGLTDRPAGQWLKLFPRFADGNAAQVSPDAIPVGRVYTIRKFDPTQNLLTIDLALHGGGVVSSWLERARPGDRCEVAGGRGGFEGVPEDCHRLVLAGDETALPAIAAILEALPMHHEAQVFIEVDNASQALYLAHAAPGNIHWIIRQHMRVNPAAALKRAVIALSDKHRGTYVWAAGEATQMRELRRGLLAVTGFEVRRVHTVGYWKKGETDHRDAAAG